MGCGDTPGSGFSFSRFTRGTVIWGRCEGHFGKSAAHAAPPKIYGAQIRFGMVGVRKAERENPAPRRLYEDSTTPSELPLYYEIAIEVMVLF